jgi:hypothetical protein
MEVHSGYHVRVYYMTTKATFLTGYTSEIFSNKNKNNNVMSDKKAVFINPFSLSPL